MQKTVLLVEDDPDLLRIYALVLGRRGYGVETAPNGVEALARVARVPVALVVLDLAMPTMSGLEVARALKSRPETAAIPILAATVHVVELRAAPGADGMFAGYLMKPFAPSDLLMAVVACIGPPLPGLAPQDAAP